MLVRQCATWKGVVSAAVYIPLLEGRVHLLGQDIHGMDTECVIARVMEVYKRAEQGTTAVLAFFNVVQALQYFGCLIPSQVYAWLTWSWLQRTWVQHSLLRIGTKFQSICCATWPLQMHIQT